MRKLIAAIGLLLAGQGTAAAADPPQLDMFAGFATQPYSSFGYAGAVAPMNGNMTSDGFLARLSGGYGGYSYQTLPGVRQAATEEIADAMLGYQIYIGGMRLSGYGGIEMQNQENADQSAAIRGGTVGAKGQIEVYSPIGDKFFGFAMGNLSSNYRSYFTFAKVGYRITDDLSFGPEGMAQGNTAYDQTSLGGGFSYRFYKDTELQLSGGYLWDLRNRGIAGSDDSGLYGKVGISTRF
jgi:hypothetical protein